MSTYSSNLRLELITTGTQAGTWGTTTNTNLGTLVEGSVAGYALVTVTSTSQALTANNGAADEARLAMLQLTSSGISSAFSVFAPPSTKQYTIYNASSYTATIYNSTVLGNTTAAGTGVAIPAGFTMTVWSNGTSFFQQNTYSNANTLNAPTITGVSAAPTASYGTNTTQLATTAFVQTALQLLHPVGSIYTSTSATNPGTAFGFGTWVAYGAGRVLLGNGGGYSAGATGGSADAIVVAHTHTGTTGGQSADHYHNVNGNTGGQSATHSHGQNTTYPSGTGPAVRRDFVSDGANMGVFPQGCNTDNASNDHSHGFNVNSGGASANHTHSFTTDNSGASGSGANLQPYVVVYMWNRTA